MNVDSSTDSSSHEPSDFSIYEPGVSFSAITQPTNLRKITKFLDSTFVVPLDKNFENILDL